MLYVIQRSGFSMGIFILHADKQNGVDNVIQNVQYQPPKTIL